MRFGRALGLLLAAILLAGWQSALTHPLVHLKSDGGFLHVGGGQGPQAPGDKKLPNLLCDAVAAVTACVASASPIAIAAHTGVDSIHARETVRLPGALSLAYQSQAPPSLL